MPIKFKTIDVRPMIAKGIEPCAAIFESVGKLGPKEGVSVIAPFLPSPLIEKLTSEGFQSRVEHLSGSWVTHFWRDE